MKDGLLFFLLVIFVMSSGILLSPARATPWPNLPSVPVTMKLVEGTTSYAVATLSNVPAGYDVANWLYASWCVDMSGNGTNILQQILLYSSLAPPANLSSQKWDMVNYILNHKQGDMMDIQNAIWYFAKMDSVGWWNGSTPSATSLAVVSDALAHGNGYVPGSGQLLALICYPTTQTQVTIIEIRRPMLPVGGYSSSAVPVGDYPYSTGVTIKAGHLVPYLASMMVLAVLLVEFRHTRARTGSGDSENKTWKQTDS